EAEPLFKRALAVRQRMLKQELPEVAESQHNLGMLYLAEDRYAEAEPLLQDALAIREKVFGSAHLNVAQTCIGLTDLYAKQERYTEANTFFQQAVFSLDRYIAEEPTLQAIKMYIYLIRKIGREDEANDLEQQLQIDQEPHLGEDKDEQ
ncbi:MAG: tetratricopeptide repeat protein, partial [Chloroflexota bacterium]|nr:tetratricopeptide repeat protein [Chloroflexota bacterium]